MWFGSSFLANSEGVRNGCCPPRLEGCNLSFDHMIIYIYDSKYSTIFYLYLFAFIRKMQSFLLGPWCTSTPARLNRRQFLWGDWTATWTLGPSTWTIWWWTHWRSLHLYFWGNRPQNGRSNQLWELGRVWFSIHACKLQDLHSKLVTFMQNPAEQIVVALRIVHEEGLLEATTEAGEGNCRTSRGFPSASCQAMRLTFFQRQLWQTTKRPDGSPKEKHTLGYFHVKVDE